MHFRTRPIALLAGLLLSGMSLIFSTSALAQDADSMDGPPVQNVEYRLSAGDKLEVFVWKEEDLSRTVAISPDGTLSYPLAGDMQAAGLTVVELKNVITSRIREYIPKALVTVTLAEVSGYRIYVLGEVNQPGEFRPGNYITVAQALTLAQGLTSFANGGSIKVVRQKDGIEQVMKFNYGRFRKGKDLSANVRLESGDVVMVP